MNPISVIAFTGPAGCGKDTAGGFLIAERGFKQLAFAAPLKEMLAVMGCPCPATAEEKEAIIPWLGVSWRHLGQTLGTEWGRRMVHDDIWVKAAEQRIRTEQGRFVITDLRFENEATMVRSVGGLVVHVQGRAAKMTSKTKKHVSEAGVQLHEKDLVIHNSGTLDDLKVNALQMAKYVGA